ncbi:hypothetical protein BS78_09G233800 [Paspalum vaginatum]|nr:hypothetical protein BS78_09G233800 [Paspalum vaginatum]
MRPRIRIACLLVLAVIVTTAARMIRGAEQPSDVPAPARLVVVDRPDGWGLEAKATAEGNDGNGKRQVPGGPDPQHR